MIIAEHSVETTVPPKAIWAIWQNVSEWNTWDHNIEHSRINGPFEAGTKGTLKPKDGPLVHTKLTRVEPYSMFSDEAKLPLARIIVTHTLSSRGKKTLVTHKIEMKGILAFFFAVVIGRNMKKNLPKEMIAMIKKAEQIS